MKWTIEDVNLRCFGPFHFIVEPHWVLLFEMGKTGVHILTVNRDTIKIFQIVQKVIPTLCYHHIHHCLTLSRIQDTYPDPGSERLAGRTWVQIQHRNGSWWKEASGGAVNNVSLRLQQFYSSSSKHFWNSYLSFNLLFARYINVISTSD